MKIKLLAMDVDGTLTDGKIYIGKDGEVMKAFNVKDGYAIAQLKKHGIIPVVITGRASEIVTERCNELGISELYQGVSNKLCVLKVIAEKYGVKQEETAYIGDDINDAECIKWAGFSGCPRDALSEIMKIADFVSVKNGGCGAVREFIDWINNANASVVIKGEINY